MKSKNKMFATLMVALFLLTTVSMCISADADADSNVTLLVDTDPATPGTLITATPQSAGYTVATATTDGSGAASLLLSTGTLWNVSGAQSGTKVSQMKTFEPSASYSTYAITLDYNEKFEYTLVYNASNFTQNGVSSLTYAGDAAGFTAVLNSVSSGLTTISEGSWGSSNDLISQCFYGVYSSGGTLIGKLNPENLALFLDGSSAASVITSNNVLFCIPTIYISTTTTSLTISNDPSSGEAIAHTFNGHIYEIYGLGVFEGTISGGKLMSVSGATPTANTTRASFRTAAAANTVENGVAMVWNWDQYMVYKYLVLEAICGFDTQGSIGFGNASGSGSSTTGQLNTSGMFAGNKAASTANPAKAFVENAWGSLWEFIDNTVYYNGYIWDGNTSTITDSTSGKTQTVAASSSGYPSAISTAVNSFGWGTAFGGAATNGTYDYQYGTSSTTNYAPIVGGSWGDDVTAGLSYVYNAGLTDTDSSLGARLAYVCDADAAAPVTTVNVTLETNNGVAATVVSVATGTTLAVPVQPVKENYVFKGWYTDSACTQAYDWATIVSSDMTLYAGYYDLLYFTSAPVQSVVVIPASSLGTFVFSAFDSGGETITWDFGDGSAPVQGLYAQHTYDKSGTYTYTATIENSAGSTVFSDEVTVEIPADDVDHDVYLIIGSIGCIAAAMGLAFRRPAVAVLGVIIAVAGFGAGVFL